MANNPELSPREREALEYIVERPSPRDELERMFGKKVIGSLFKKGMVRLRDNVQATEGDL
jgi:hypothetical protein